MKEMKKEHEKAKKRPSGIESVMPLKDTKSDKAGHSGKLPMRGKGKDCK